MKDINFEYAVNFNENEARYQLIQERLNTCTLYFTQNTLLQFFCIDLMCEVIDVSIALSDGERGNYIYQKAIELCAATDLVKEKYEAEGMSEKLSALALNITNSIKNK